MAKINSRNNRVYHVPLTKALLIEYFGEDPKMTVKGYAFYLDGRLAGIAGIRYCGSEIYAFSDMKKDVNVSKATIWRCTLLVMSMIDDMKVPVVAVADHYRKTAPTFLTRLGFDFVGSFAEDGTLDKYSRMRR